MGYAYEIEYFDNQLGKMLKTLENRVELDRHLDYGKHKRLSIPNEGWVIRILDHLGGDQKVVHASKELGNHPKLVPDDPCPSGQAGMKKGSDFR